MQKRSLSFLAMSQSRYFMDGWSWGCQKYWRFHHFSVTGKPTADFDNLDFKIASGLRTILTGNFKKQVSTAEGTAQSEERSLAGRQIAWMIYGFFNISSDCEAILDYRDLSKVQSIEERQRSSLRNKGSHGTISSHWQTYWQHLGESVQDGSWKVGRVEMFAAGLRSRDDIRRSEIRRLQIEVHGPKTPRA